jgi:hypothetical protein
VAEHSCYHAWHAGYTLQEDESRDPFLFGHDVAFGKVAAVGGGSVSGDNVHSPAEYAHSSESDFILPGMGFPVGGSDGKDLFFRVSGQVKSHVRGLCVRIFEAAMTRLSMR